MAFSQVIVDELLARTGRMCAVCNRLHGVQVHHIALRSQGGTDDATNAIPLCPTCHDAVHAEHAPGRTTRLYTEAELRKHLERTIDLAHRQVALRPGNEDWLRDVETVRFFAQCLDRPAFCAFFHEERSFAELDQALEDTSLAINTGHWRTRDGTLIERGLGKSRLTNHVWREHFEAASRAIDEARTALRSALRLDRMLIENRRGHHRHDFDEFDSGLRGDRALGATIDRLRDEAVGQANIVLAEIGDHELPLIGTSR